MQSIPFYVEVSEIFVALVPELRHEDTGRLCNYTSWLSRGWCRLTSVWLSCRALLKLTFHHENHPKPFKVDEEGHVQVKMLIF